MNNIILKNEETKGISISNTDLKNFNIEKQEIQNISLKNNETQQLKVTQEQEQDMQIKNSEIIKVVSQEGIIYEAGDNIKIDGNIISVITTNEVSSDNTKPITSAGVDNVVGNINVLLETI